VASGVHVDGANGPGGAVKPPLPLRPLVVAAVLLSLTACERPPQASLDSPLTSVEQVRRLPVHSRDQVPVRLRGIITYVDAQLEQFFFQDSTGGLRSDNVSNNVMLAAGSFVEMTGTVTEGGSSPAGAYEKIRLISSGALPLAVRTRPGDLVSGKLQYRFVQIEGRVQSADVDDSGRLVLMLDSEGRSVKALVRDQVGGVDYRSYPGAEMLVSGVLAASTDADGAIGDLRVLVPSAQQLAVLVPAKPVAGRPGKQSGLPTLTSAAAVHSLSEDQARMSYPVHFRAVVTFFGPVGHQLTVQDDTDGIYLYVGAATAMAPLRAGQLVEVEGFSGPGDFAPVVANPRIRVLGEQALPEPLRMDINQLLSEPPDSRWLEARGTVCSLDSANGFVLVGVRSANRHLVLTVAYTDELPHRLLYAHIRFQGAVAPVFNRKRQLVAVQVRVPEPKFIQVEESAPPSPPALRSILQLRQYSLGSGLDQLSRIRGTVTLTHPTGPTYISDATGSVAIDNHTESHLAIGDVVEATGFAEVDALNPVLKDADLVKLGHAAEPKAQRSTITDILEDRWDPRLVAVDGSLVDTVTAGADRRLVLQAGGTLFNARMESGRMPALRNGSLVRVGGIVSYDAPGRRLVPRGFTILLRSAADVVVLRDASWWTRERTLRLAGFLAALVLAAFAWVSVLRRRVRQQTADLRGSRQMLQLVLDHIPQRVFWKDRESRFLGCNEACAADVGLATAQDIVGKTAYDFANWRAAADLYAADDRQVMETGLAKVGYEEPMVDADGVQRCLRSSKAPLFGSDGSVIGVLGTYEDITESKRAEEKLQRYSAELAETNEEMKRFTYIVSHDLRAPLVSLKGFSTELRYSLDTVRKSAEVLLASLEEPGRIAVARALQEEVPEALGFIESSVARMDHLIGALLRLSRVGYREFHMEELDAGVLVQETLRSLAHQIESRKIKLTIGQLPIISSDRTAIEQIFGNLLDNAIKYLDPHRQGHIEVSAEKKADELVFQVRDNGRGIAEEDMDKVFAPFRRAGPQDVPGEGMGLAYVRALLHRLDGRIECRSQLGVGTTFTFTLPRVR
jgi:PAS domain S-box-containing protein